MDQIVELAEQCNGEVDFVMVGVGDKLKEIAPSNMKCYPQLWGDEYEEVVVDCDIGISSAALFRIQKDMEACPLKTRDYLARGMPVILPYRDTAILEDSLPAWVLQLPNEEGALKNSATAVIDFVTKLKDFVVSLEEVDDVIGMTALEHRRLFFFAQLVRSE